MDDTEIANEVESQVRRAFADSQPAIGGIYFDASQAVDNETDYLTGQTWQEVLALNDPWLPRWSDFGFLADPTDLAYYLPAYLVRALETEEVSDLGFELEKLLTSPEQRYPQHCSLPELLNEAQRGAVLGFLGYRLVRYSRRLCLADGDEMSMEYVYPGLSALVAAIDAWRQGSTLCGG